MKYDEFFAQFTAAHDAWYIGQADAETEIARLRALIPDIEEPEKHSFAEFALADWEREKSPEARDRMTRASNALARACAGGGSDAERIERARRGRHEIAAIAAESGDAAEQDAILAMNETLTMLIESLDA
jgi:hypothetical protein